MDKGKDAQQLIIDSFKDLMLAYPFEKITIKMITNHADLARPTFYTHFGDKHAIIEEILDRELFETLHILIENDMRGSLLKMVFSYFSKNRPLYREMFKITGQNSFEDILKEKFNDVFFAIIEKEPIKESAPVLDSYIAQCYSLVICHTVKLLITRNDLSNISDQEVYNAALYMATHSLQDMFR